MRFLRVISTGLLTAALFAAGPASALTITFDLNFEFSGGTDPEGATPWATITIDDTADTGGANSVRVTITNNLVDNEFISELSLNLDPLLDPTQLTFSAVNMNAVGSPAGDPNDFTFTSGVDFFQADGDGKFDMLLELPPPPGSFASKYTAGEMLVFDLTYSAALSAADFDFGSAPGGPQGTFRAAAHVQGIGPDNADSGWIGPVPEPSVALLIAAGALATGIAIRKQR